MSDFEKELKDFLETNWTTTGTIKKTDVNFHYGYKKPVQIRPKKMDVQVGYLRHSQVLHDGSGDIEGDGGLTVLLTVRSARDTTASVQTAKATRTLMRDEVQRILKEVALPSGWEWAYVSSFENRDLPDKEPPYIRELLTVTVKYLET